MNDIKTASLKKLVDELNRLDEEIKNIQIKQDEIIFEVCDRVPILKDKKGFQPKILKK